MRKSGEAGMRGFRLRAVGWLEALTQAFYDMRKGGVE